MIVPVHTLAGRAQEPMISKIMKKDIFIIELAGYHRYNGHIRRKGEASYEHVIH